MLKKTNAYYQNISREIDQTNQIDQAIEKCEQAVKKAEENGDIAYRLFFEGEKASLYGNFKRAFAFLEKALSLDPDNVLFLVNLGIALSNLGQDKEASVFFDKALLIESDNVPALYQKGASLLKLGKTKEALSYLERAQELEPDYSCFRDTRGTVPDQ